MSARKPIRSRGKAEASDWKYQPVERLCACGCGQTASHGFSYPLRDPEVWYAWKCIPPDLRR